MDPWQSWGIVVVAGALVYWYYIRRTGRANARQAATAIGQAARTRASEAADSLAVTANSALTSSSRQQRRSQQPKTATFSEPLVLTAEKTAPASSSKTSQSSATSAAKSAKKRKGAKPALNDATASASTAVSSVPTQAEDEDDEAEAMNDADWAKQLAANKAGVSFNGGTSKAQQSRTQSQRQAAQPAAPVAMPSSTDVSDMLEPAAPGPSILRLTGEEPAKSKKAQSNGVEQKAETKKQRQNRKKREAAQAQREEDEQQRRVLLEQQRRSAREARGEPAKNGVPLAQPASNAWSATSNGGPAAAKVDVSSAPLLDTFDHDNASISSSADNVPGSIETPATNNSVYENNDLPSEEKQMEMIREMDGWEEVPTKVTKKKQQQQKKTVNAAEDLSSMEPTKENVKPVPSAAAVQELVRSVKNPSKNGFAALEDNFTASSSAKGHPQDSDWAV